MNEVLPVYTPVVIKYPLHLSSSVASLIMQENFLHEVERELRGKEDYPRYDYGFCGTIEENGDIEVAMTASGDDGFMQFSGPVFKKKLNNIKYLAPAIKAFKHSKIMRTFEEENNNRISERLREIYKQMFGEDGLES